MTSVRPVPSTFDARFSALWRRYVYRLWDESSRPDPVTRFHVAPVRGHLDLDCLNTAGTSLLGLRDFAAFCKHREGATTIRTLLDCHAERLDDRQYLAGIISARHAGLRAHPRRGRLPVRRGSRSTRCPSPFPSKPQRHLRHLLGGPMSQSSHDDHSPTHYFTTPEGPTRTRTITVNVWDDSMTMTTAGGVFSGTRLDPGTAVLMRSVTPPPSNGTFLDLGCGYGPIACALARACSGSHIVAVDVNDLAIDLTTRNAKALRVGDRVHACRPEEVDPDLRFDEIWSRRSG